MAGISFQTDLTRLFYTAYRPIILRVRATDSDVAYIRGEIYRLTNTGAWVSTGVLINAFQKNGSSNMYEMNIMEYCRPYIGNGLTCHFNWAGYTLPAKYDGVKIYVKCWPVRYSTTAVGQLVDDLAEEKDSKLAVIVGTNTDEFVSHDIWDGFMSVDRYVLGNNGEGSTESCKPMTNMPFANILSHNHFDGWPLNYIHTDPNPYPLGISIDMADHRAPAYYYMNSTKTDLMLMVLYKDLNGAYAGVVFVPVSAGINLNKIPMHPIELQTFMQLHSGISGNWLVDTNGDLVVSQVQIWLGTTWQPQDNSWGYHKPGDNSRHHRHQVCYYTQMAKGLGSCKANGDNKVRIHWQNALGGYDWFNFYGTITKAVKTSGTRYEPFNEGYFRGPRNTKELWKKREDLWTVTSQPLNSETAEWLQEMISSPLVWREMEIKDAMDFSRWGLENQLSPILIVPGDYAVFSTENNIHYLEFKFTLANANTQQRG